MDSAKRINGEPARVLPASEPMESTGKRKRKPTVKAVNVFESSDESEEEEEEDDEEEDEDEDAEEEEPEISTAPAKSSKAPIITKPRGPRDIYIGVLSDFPELRVYATRASSSARARVFFQDVPAGKVLQDFGVMSNGMVKITRVVLDKALLTDEVMAAAKVDPSETLTDRTPMMALVRTYHKMATADIPESDHEDDSNDEDVKDPKIRVARARDRVNRNRKRKSKSKAVNEDVDEGDEFGGGDGDEAANGTGGRKPTALLAGCLKENSDVEVYVRISTHTNRSPYVFYTSKDAKGRLKYQDIKFLPEYRRANEVLAKEYFRSILAPAAKHEPINSDGKNTQWLFHNLMLTFPKADDEDTMLLPAPKRRKYVSKASAAQAVGDQDDSLLQPPTQKRKYTRRVSKPVPTDEAVDLELENALLADVPDEVLPPVAQKRKYKPRTPKVSIPDANAEEGVTPTAQANTRSVRARFSEPSQGDTGVHGNGFSGIAPQVPQGPQFQAINSPVVVPAPPPNVSAGGFHGFQPQGGFMAPVSVPLPAHPQAQMPDPGAAIFAVQAYSQHTQAYTQGLLATIQKQKSDLETLRLAHEKQTHDLVSARAQNHTLEQQVNALQTRPNANPPLPDETISGRLYTRDSADSENPGLLRYQDEMEYDWGSKKWNRIITMRELDLVVDSEADPVRRTVQDEDFLESKLKDGGMIMVRCEGRFVNVDGRQFWERIVYQEVEPSRRASS